MCFQFPRNVPSENDRKKQLRALQHSPPRPSGRVGVSLRPNYTSSLVASKSCAASTQASDAAPSQLPELKNKNKIHFMTDCSLWSTAEPRSAQARVHSPRLPTANCYCSLFPRPAATPITTSYEQVPPLAPLLTSYIDSRHGARAPNYLNTSRSPSSQ